jgi:hypothetical protein
MISKKEATSLRIALSLHLVMTSKRRRGLAIASAAAGEHIA